MLKILLCVFFGHRWMMRDVANVSFDIQTKPWSEIKLVRCSRCGLDT